MQPIFQWKYMHCDIRLTSSRFRKIKCKKQKMKNVYSATLQESKCTHSATRFTTPCVKCNMSQLYSNSK